MVLFPLLDSFIGDPNLCGGGVDQSHELTRECGLLVPLGFE